MGTRTNYHKLGRLIQGEIFSHSSKSLKSKIIVSAGLHSLQRFLNSVPCFFQLLVASWQCLAYRYFTPISASTFPLLFIVGVANSLCFCLIKVHVTKLRSYPDNPGWIPSLKVLNLITSFPMCSNFTVLPYKLKFTYFGERM